MLGLCTLQDQLDAQKAAGVGTGSRPGFAYMTCMSIGKEPKAFSPTPSSTKERVYEQEWKVKVGKCTGSGRDLIGNRPFPAALWWGFHGSKILALVHWVPENFTTTANQEVVFAGWDCSHDDCMSTVVVSFGML